VVEVFGVWAGPERWSPTTTMPETARRVLRIEGGRESWAKPFVAETRAAP